MGSNLAHKLEHVCYEWLETATKQASTLTLEKRLQAKLNSLYDKVFVEAEKRLRQTVSPADTSLVVAAIDDSRVQLQNTMKTFMEDQLQLPQQFNAMIQEQAFEASMSTTLRMSGNVQEVLTQGYREGKTINQIAVDLRKEFKGMQDYELERIARTEVHSNVNLGKYTQLLQTPAVKFIRWSARLDQRTRDSHRALHGQITEIGQPFSNGLKFPGDRSGGSTTIKEWINCRCTSVPWVLPPGKVPPPGHAGKESTTSYHFMSALKWFYENELIDLTEEGKGQVPAPKWDELSKLPAKEVKAMGTPKLRQLVTERGLPKEVADSLKGQDLRAIVRNPSRIREILEKAGNRTAKNIIPTKLIEEAVEAVVGKPGKTKKILSGSSAKEQLEKGFSSSVSKLMEDKLKKPVSIKAEFISKEGSEDIGKFSLKAFSDKGKELLDSQFIVRSDEVFFSDIVVADELKRRGIGTAYLEQLEDFARLNNKSRIELIAQDEGVALWGRRGYTITENRELILQDLRSMAAEVGVKFTDEKDILNLWPYRYDYIERWPGQLYMSKQIKRIPSREAPEKVLAVSEVVSTNRLIRESARFSFEYKGKKYEWDPDNSAVVKFGTDTVASRNVLYTIRSLLINDKPAIKKVKSIIR